MPGVDLRGEPPPATDSPPSDESSQLQLNLQRQLEEDIASDTYTECNIKHQEKEILAYLKTIPLHPTHTKENTDEAQGYSTAKCVSPNPSYNIDSSPKTDLTKEYYALLPIDSNLLERELREQEVLSNCFQSIIKSQARDLEKFSNLQRNKPSSLTLGSSHSSKTTKHSITCDSLNKNRQTNNILTESDNFGEIKSNTKSSQSNKNSNDSTIRKDTRKDVKPSEVVLDVSKEATYSPDSLMTDDLSSASDYLSAAYSYTLSPEAGLIGPTHIIVDDSVTVMEHLITSYDSGLENTGLFESLTSHVTLTDTSLTESTLHDLSICQDSSSVPLTETNLPTTQKSENIEKPCSSKKSPDNNTQEINDPLNHNEIMNCNSSKEEKQRQNEEIVILESSSLSSETGSWESVFPPKLTPQDLCDKFIHNERQLHSESKHIDNDTTTIGAVSNYKDDCSGLVKKSPFKSTSCFIDAASLVEEEDEILTIHVQHSECLISTKPESIVMSEPSKSSALKNKSDLSPNDWSENDNDDSIDTDSIQKDLSPTFLVDNLVVNTSKANPEIINTASTPNNSILSVKASSLMQYDSDFSSDMSITLQSPVRQNSREAGNVTKPSQASSSRSWVVNMSPVTKEKNELENTSTDTNQKTKGDKTCESLRNSAQYTSSPENGNKSRSSVESDSCERSSHKFYVDLSSLPDVELSNNKTENESANEKKNMFSMFIGFDENSTIKEMPSRLNAKKAVATKAPAKESPHKVKIIKEGTLPQSSLNKSDETKSPITFEIYEVLCKDPKFTISEIIRLHEKIRKDGLQAVTDDFEDEHNKALEKQSKSYKDPEKQSKSYKDQGKQSKSASADHSSRTVTKVEKPNAQEDALFVKLSDLDKPVSKTDTLVGKSEQRSLDERMTRSIPENNWSDQNQASSSRSNEVISSFHSENTLSLNRLFPHLRNEFSRSMPGSLSSRTRLSHRLDDFSRVGETDDQASETSDMSSVQSSFCPSIVENSTTEETSQASSLIGNCQSRLGQDLLRMFLEEIAPDVIVEVSGRRIKAHKCILSSRCQYFAGILSGGWVESAGNVISLPTFSFNVVHFALCHIYSGVSTIPDTISIVELATLADMLGLEGLKEAIMFTLKAKYCHHFHRPCTVCKAGILECLTLASVYGLDELYRKCLKWITKYFSVVWPTKAFATLPSELLDKCYHQLIIELTLDNCVDTAYGCGITVSVLNSSRWSDVIIRMCHRVARAIANFMAPKLVTVLRNIETLPPDPPYCAAQALDECIRAAIAWAPPEELCRAYEMIAHSINEKLSHRLTRPDLINNGKVPEPDNFLHAQANPWFSVCEKAIVKDATRVCSTQAYRDLPSDLRNRLQSLGCIQRTSQPPILSPSHNRRNRSNQGPSNAPHSSSRSQSSAANSSDIDQMRASFVPYSLKPLPPGTQQILQELRKTSRTISPKVRTTKAQEERARFNLTKTTLSQERLNTKSPSKTYENAKPRYLESRVSQDIFKKLSQSLVLPHQMRATIKLKSNEEPPPQESTHSSMEVQARSQDSLVFARKEPPTQVTQDKLLTPTRYRKKTKTLTLSQECSAYVKSRDEGSSQVVAQNNLTSTTRSRITAQIVSRDISVAASEPHTTATTQHDNFAIAMSPRMKVQNNVRVASNAQTSRSLTEASVQILPHENTATPKPRVDLQTLSPKVSRNVTKTQNGSMVSQRNEVQKAVRNSIVQENQANLMGSCNNVEASSDSTSGISARPGNKPNERKALSQDSLATSSKPHTPEPSTDSLSESQNSNRYATYTKSKHPQNDPKPVAASRKVTRVQTRASNPKVKSKIPVYLSQTSKSLNKQYASDSQSVGSHSLSTSAATSATTSSVQSRSKIHDKTSSSCSLMNATKSSSAKMVAKVVKDNSRAKPASKNRGTQKRPQQRVEKSPADIPVMERSGTFLKDEPTFGDRPHLFDANESDQEL